MIENLLLDLDGTLTDPKVGITRCIQFAMEQLGEPAPQMDQLTWCIGPPLRGSFARLLKTSEDGILDQALEFYRQRFAEKGMFENVVYPDVASTLQAIQHTGCQIFLATAKPGVFARQILEHFELSPFFRGIYGSELDGRLSDKGELIAHILASENLIPKAALMVGDRKHDIIGGRTNGVMTAAVSYGYGTKQEIDASAPDLVFETFSDLLSFLKIEESP